MAHWAKKSQNLLSTMFGSSATGVHGQPQSLFQEGQPPPQNAVGCPITSVICCEGGLLTCGADGVVLHHQLQKA